MAAIQKRTSRDGSVTYRVRVRLKGFPLQTASFERLTDARKWAQDIEADIRNGRHFRSSQSKKFTLAQVIDRYIKTVLSKKVKNQKTRIQELEWWKREIGAYLLADISPNLISERKEKLREGITQNKKPRSSATINRYQAALSHCMTVAVNEWELLPINPVSRVKKEQEPRGRVRFLDDDERTRFLAACKASSSKFLYLAVIMSLSTGMRKGELLGLAWSDIDTHRRRITVHETKNGEKRGVPLTGMALELLQEYSKVRRLDTTLVFPSPSDPKKPINLEKSFQAALKEAGIRDFRWHDMRHCTASYLTMNGATLAEVAEVLGHKTLIMAKRYSHLSDSHTSKVVESMNQKIFG